MNAAPALRAFGIVWTFSTALMTPQVAESAAAAGPRVTPDRRAA